MPVGWRAAAGDDRRRPARRAVNGRIPGQPPHRAGGIRYSELPREGRERLEALLGDLYRPHPAGACRNPLGRGEAPSRRHVFRVDRPVRRREPVLLPDPPPDNPRRVRPPVGHRYDNDKPSRDHIHTVVRTPNGNDYGRDLLRQHYTQHDHAALAHAHVHATGMPHHHEHGDHHHAGGRIPFR